MHRHLRLGILWAALVVAYLGCSNPPEAPLRLDGTWGTSALRYQGEYIEICSHSLTLGVQGGEHFVYAITRQEQEDTLEGTLVTLLCLDELGQKNRFRFLFDASGDGTLRYYAERDVVWTRKGASLHTP